MLSHCSARRSELTPISLERPNTSAGKGQQHSLREQPALVQPEDASADITDLEGEGA
jgi:hypothetical protein